MTCWHTGKYVNTHSQTDRTWWGLSNVYNPSIEFDGEHARVSFHLCVLVSAFFVCVSIMCVHACSCVLLCGLSSICNAHIIACLCFLDDYRSRTPPFTTHNTQAQCIKVQRSTFVLTKSGRVTFACAAGDNETNRTHVQLRRGKIIFGMKYIFIVALVLMLGGSVRVLVPHVVSRGVTKASSWICFEWVSVLRPWMSRCSVADGELGVSTVTALMDVTINLVSQNLRGFDLHL